MEEKSTKRHKGTFVGGHLYDKQVEKFNEIMEELADVTGQPANQAYTLRYIIEHFDFEASPLGKEEALAGAMA